MSFCVDGFVSDREDRTHFALKPYHSLNPSVEQFL